MAPKVFIDASKLIQFGHSLDNAEARAVIELCELQLMALVKMGSGSLTVKMGSGSLTCLTAGWSMCRADRSQEVSLTPLDAAGHVATCC